MDLSTNKGDRMLVLVEQWRDSGQSRKDFCQFHGIKVSTLSYWIKKSEEQFTGMDFKQILPSQVSSGRIDIIYPNGARVGTDGDLSLVARLIHIY